MSKTKTFGEIPKDTPQEDKQEPPNNPFDFKKLKINEEGRYSITRPYEAKQIKSIIRKTTLGIIFT